MISCIVPVCGKFSGNDGLKNILSQLQDQTYKDIEIIAIVCCVENFQDIPGVTSYYYHHKVFDRNNHDAFYAKLNFGLELVKGQYAGFFSANDKYAKKYLEKMINCLELNEADFVLCNFKSHHGEYREQESNIQSGHIAAGCYIVKTDIAKGVGGFSEIGMGDFEFAKKVEEQEFKITKLNEMLYIHK